MLPKDIVSIRSDLRGINITSQLDAYLNSLSMEKIATLSDDIKINIRRTYALEMLVPYSFLSRHVFERLDNGDGMDTRGRLSGAYANILKALEPEKYDSFPPPYKSHVVKKSDSLRKETDRMVAEYIADCSEKIEQLESMEIKPTSVKHSTGKFRE